MSDSSHTFLLDEPDQKPNSGSVRRGFGLAILGALALVLALIGIDVTVISAAQRPAPRPVITKQVVKVEGTAPVASTIYMSVSPGIKPGPDGKLHDAFSVTSLQVHAGKPIKLVIDNTDDTVHSITSPAAGVNIVVRPGTHSYTLLVTKSGIFQWYCNYPCDPYSMMHDGYMRGTITSI
jgi:heme/copper-type cytochrome/quinol oxidase subunit 2